MVWSKMWIAGRRKKKIKCFSRLLFHLESKAAQELSS